jgi:diketogulonate reductase-like aldo/keto reductase
MGHSVLPKSDNEAWTRENIDVSGWCISEDLMAKFTQIEQARIPYTYVFHSVSSIFC